MNLKQNLRQFLLKRMTVTQIDRALFEIHPYVFVNLPTRRKNHTKTVVCWLEIEWPGREKDNVFVSLTNWDSAPVLKLPMNDERLQAWFPGFSANSAEVLVRLVQSRKQHSDEELFECGFGPGKIRSWIPKGALEELP